MLRTVSELKVLLRFGGKLRAGCERRTQSTVCKSKNNPPRPDVLAGGGKEGWRDWGEYWIIADLGTNGKITDKEED